MTLTAQKVRNAYAEAVEASSVATMCRADVERLILNMPKVGLQLVHLLGEPRDRNPALNRLREVGLVEIHRRYIQVKNIEALKQATEDSFGKKA